MLRLDLLGGLGLFDGRGHPIEALLSQPKSLAPLILVAVSANGSRSRDELAGILWPDSGRVRGKRNLRKRLHWADARRQSLRTSAGSLAVALRDRAAFSGVIPSTSSLS